MSDRIFIPLRHCCDFVFIMNRKYNVCNTQDPELHYVQTVKVPSQWLKDLAFTRFLCIR
jgi:hypothetical protein